MRPEDVTVYPYRGTVLARCRVCGQHIHLVDGEWRHKLTGAWADLPVRHRATHLPEGER